MERIGRFITQVFEEIIPASSTSQDNLNDDMQVKMSVLFLRKTGFFQIKKPEIEHFTFVRHFSYGCDLYKGYYKKKLVCIKEYDLSKVDDCRKFSKLLKDDMERVEDLETSYHVGEVKGVYEVDKSLKVGVVSEYHLRSLEDVINMSRDMKKKIPWEKKVSIVEQIVLGMIELHNTDIVHRKLSAKNIVFDRNNNVKIINFIGTKYEEEQQQRSLKTKFFDSYYQSPEYTLSDTYEKPTDVYSFAILIFELLTQQVDPFGQVPCDIPLQIARKRIPLPELPAKFIESNSFWLVEIMHSSWTYLPERRPTFHQIQARLPASKTQMKKKKKSPKKKV